MSDRAEVPSEKSLHRRMVANDTIGTGIKGGVVGTAVGAGLRHLGHAGKHAPLYGAAAGTLTGAVAGYHRGRERVLKDVVARERAEAKLKKACDVEMWAGFASALKVAEAPPAPESPAWAGTKAMLRDVPVSLLASGIGYAASRGLIEAGVKHFDQPLRQNMQTFQKVAPWVVALSTLGYGLSHRHIMDVLHRRRQEAEAKAQHEQDMHIQAIRAGRK